MPSKQRGQAADGPRYGVSPALWRHTILKTLAMVIIVGGSIGYSAHAYVPAGWSHSSSHR